MDDQLTLAKGQAQEAVLGVFSAAVDAVEAEAEAQEILNGAKEPEPQPEPAPLPEPVPEPETPAVESAPAAVAPPAEPEPEEGLVEEEDVEEVEEEPAAAAADSPAATAAADGTLAGEEAEAAAPPPDEDDDQVESLDAIPHPSLSFESAPGKNQEMNAVESKARDMSVHAHKLVKENK